MSTRRVKLAEFIIHDDSPAMYEFQQEEVRRIQEKALMIVDEICITLERSVNPYTFDPMLTINAHLTDEEYALYVLIT